MHLLHIQRLNGLSSSRTLHYGVFKAVDIPSGGGGHGTASFVALRNLGRRGGDGVERMRLTAAVRSTIYSLVCLPLGS